MAPAQLELVQEATALFKEIRGDTAQAVPSWPLGLPDWYADSFALMLAAPGRRLVYAWLRGGEDAELQVRLGAGVRAEHLVERYPRSLRAWGVTDSQDGAVVLLPGLAGPSARIYEIVRN
jgi:alpha-galactosidase